MSGLLLRSKTLNEPAKVAVHGETVNSNKKTPENRSFPGKDNGLKQQPAGDAHAQQAAGSHLKRGMSHKFLEPGLPEGVDLFAASERLCDALLLEILDDLI